jgi:hypothetical protein
MNSFNGSSSSAREMECCHASGCFSISWKSARKKCASAEFGLISTALA